VVQDDVANFVYPMPLTAHEKDETFVGRIRRDDTQPKTLNCWIVSDNLRKGAATNAVQIAEYLLEKGLLEEKRNCRVGQLIHIIFLCGPSMMGRIFLKRSY
jgi:aspartate-semialdehyde dehydrogenase